MTQKPLGRHYIAHPVFKRILECEIRDKYRDAVANGEAEEGYDDIEDIKAALEDGGKVTFAGGVAYFQVFNDARDHGQKHGKGYPAWRVVSYERGFAVQARISGPYFGKNGELILT